MQRCGLSPPSVPRRDRRNPVDRGNPQLPRLERPGEAAAPCRPAAGVYRRSEARHVQRRLCRLVDAQMVRPDPQPEQRPGRAGDVGLPQLAERVIPLEQAVRPLRAGAGHRQGIDLLGRAGQLLPHQQQSGRLRGGHGPALSRHPPAMRAMPPSSVREVRPGRLLLVRLVFRPRGCEAEPGVRIVRPRIGGDRPPLGRSHQSANGGRPEAQAA